ncbi:MAG TPA: helix-turn-helix transcriptional regulator [Ktedonobacteraceae bacterium]|jgi:transcriptional regulator with XRE-family HTH domain|nr:helix-turn-helix transcriptional regulator [Ktedonobacteraceae bacterium]
MNTPEMQQLKMAWLAAKADGNTGEQMRLLHEYPGEREELIDFIAAYHASGGASAIKQDIPVIAMTQRARQRALDRVFGEAAAVATLTELRKQRKMTKVAAAQGLRLSVDVWNKFEAGAIELTSLTQRQLERLANFFQVSIDQFGNLLQQSQPEIALNRRQTRQGAQSEQQGLQKQSFEQAVARSSMPPAEQAYWLGK